MKMGTYTGRKIDLATMTKDDIDLTDITISLSRQNRYMGHCLVDWPVNKHSIFCAMIAQHLGYSEDIQKLMMLHDAHETWFQDRPTPIQKQFPDPAWEAARDRCDVVLHDFFGMSEQFNDEANKKIVLSIDKAAGIIELICFRPNYNWSEVKDQHPAPVRKIVETLIRDNVKVPIELIQMDWKQCCQDFYEVLAVIHFEGNTGTEIIVDEPPKDTDETN